MRRRWAPVGDRWLLRLGTRESGGFDEAALTVVEGIAANIEPALRRTDRQRAAPHSAAGATDDAAALRRLNELTVAPGAFDETVERLLSLGCEYFDLDTGILARIDGGDYEAEAVVDATGTHEVGATYGLERTMCEATLGGSRTEPLAFADVADTEHRDHPAAGSIGAYIAAPVVVGDETYGTVNFSMATPRTAPFRPVEREFVTLVAEWVGTEIERRRRFDQLERYETILEAVGDPVYALDTEGRLTFLNAAAERASGHSADALASRASAGGGAAVVGARGNIHVVGGVGRPRGRVEYRLEVRPPVRRENERVVSQVGQVALDAEIQHERRGGVGA